VSEAPISKTRRKKDMHALQALGEALVALTGAQLAALDLPERLADAIAEAKRIHGFEARRRQMQYIGRLMRDVDPAPIADYIERLRNARSRSNSQQHDVERWRDRLLEEDQAMAELAALVPGLEVQQIRTLIRNARNERARNQPPKAQRALFRLLRETLFGDSPPPDTPAATD